MLHTFDITFVNQRTEEREVIRKEYALCNYFEALEKVIIFVKEELVRKYNETQTIDWLLDNIKSYPA